MPTDHTTRTVLVAGGTGRLQPLAETLLGRGHAVRVMTRDPGSPAAARLRGLGAELVVGDFDDAASIAAAAAGADALLAGGTAHRVGPEGELRHGMNVADAAAAARVRHLVYASGDGAAADSPLPLFRAKAAIEAHIRATPVRHTILAPVYFMENLFNPWNLPALRGGIFPSPISVGAPLQQLAIADLAAFAALAIERPDELAGKRIRLASDEITAVDAAAAVSRVTGEGLRAERIPSEELPAGARALFQWLERVGHRVDLDALHRRYPELGWRRYPEWVSSQRWRFADLCPRSPAGAH